MDAHMHAYIPTQKIRKEEKSFRVFSKLAVFWSYYRDAVLANAAAYKK